MADILIKGMELPKNDLHGIVLFFEKDGFKEARSCYNTSLIEGITAIPVPEHDDLIDRDALATAMRDYLLNHFGERLDEDLSNAIYALIAEATVVLERT